MNKMCFLLLLFKYNEQKKNYDYKYFLSDICNGQLVRKQIRVGYRILAMNELQICMIKIYPLYLGYMRDFKKCTLID